MIWQWWTFQELQNASGLLSLLSGEAFSKIWTRAADFRRVFETAARKQCDTKLIAYPGLGAHRDRVTQKCPVARSHRRVPCSLRSSPFEQPPLPPACDCIACTTMRVTIKKWHAVATWRWDMPEDEVCGICRVQFDGTCPTCKYPGDDCTLRWWSGSVVSLQKV
jgi:hypothetical protein